MTHDSTSRTSTFADRTQPRNSGPFDSNISSQTIRNASAEAVSAQSQGLACAPSCSDRISGSVEDKLNTTKKSGGKKGKLTKRKRKRRRKNARFFPYKNNHKRRCKFKKPATMYSEEEDPPWRPRQTLSGSQLPVWTRARTAATCTPQHFRRAVLAAYTHSSSTEGLAHARKILSSRTRSRGLDSQDGCTPVRRTSSVEHLQISSGYGSVSRPNSQQHHSASASSLQQSTSHVTPKRHGQPHSLSQVHVLSARVADELVKRRVTRKRLYSNTDDSSNIDTTHTLSSGDLYDKIR